MRFNSVLHLRLPDELKAKIDETASRSARKPSDLVREGLVIGLAALDRRASEAA